MARPRKSTVEAERPEEIRMLSAADAKDAKKRLEALGDAYHFRVRKRAADGSVTSYIGRLPSDTPDIEEAVKRQWGDGAYVIQAHWFDNKKVEQLPPITLNLGDPDKRMYTASFGPKGPRSDRLMHLEEEIEATRREKELLRAKRELEKVQEETQTDDEGLSTEEAARFIALEDIVRELKRKNEELERERKEKTITDHIARLESKIEQLAKPRVDPEVERLRRELEATRENKYQQELAALKADLEKKNRIGVVEIAQIAAPFAPILADVVKSRQTASLQMIDTITKVGTLLKDSMPKGLDLEKIIGLAPLIAKLIPKQDNGAMFEMIGNIVAPLIEAAAAGGGGGGGGDDMASVVKQVLGAVQQAMKPQQGNMVPAANFPAYPPAYAAPQGGPQGVIQAPPPRIATQPAQQNPPATPQRAAPQRRTPQQNENVLPITQFALGMAGAISRRDENFQHWVNQAERILAEPDLVAIRKYSDGGNFSSFLSGQPGVNTSILTTAYARRWLSEFLKTFKGGIDEDQAPVVVKKAPIPAPAAPSGSLADILGISGNPPADHDDDEDEGEEAPVAFSKEIAPGIRRPNTFDYPPDSSLRVVRDYDTPAGTMDLVVETPTKATVEKRERERVEMVRKNANPPECNIKVPETTRA